MKSGLATTKYRIILAIVSVLLVLSSCLFIAGSWFTYNQDVIGEFEQPVFDIIITADSDSSSAAVYCTPNDLEKPVQITIGANSNVVNNVLRVWIDVEWGTLENEVFTKDDSIPNALIPNFTNYWTKSVEALNQTNSTNYSYTQGEPTCYYYNSIVTKTQPLTTVLAFENLSFKTGADASLYAGKTAKINIIVELAPASTETFNEWVVPATDTYYEYGYCAPASWQTSINS